MKKLEEIAKSIIGMKVDENVKENIVAEFEDYEFDGENSVIVEQSSNTGYDYVAYADTENAPQVLIRVEDNKITQAWEVE